VKLTNIIKEMRYLIYIYHSDDKKLLVILDDPKINTDKQRKRPKIIQTPVKSPQDHDKSVAM
jgi:hypothetical protein